MSGEERSAGASVKLDLLIDRIDHLPTLPAVALRVGSLVEDPESDSQQIAQVMRSDQALTARVLALVNSAHYAIPGGVTDVRRAISYLGYNTVYQLVITVSVFDALPKVEGSAFDLDALWKHALATGICAEAAARQIGTDAPEDAFSAGLLHDIGKVALASVAREQLESVVREAVSKGISFHQAEHELGLPSHDLLGRKLAERWRLPGTIVAGIGHHHRLDEGARALLPRNLRAVPDLVALGDTLARRAQIGNAGDDLIGEADPALLERLNLSQRALSTIADGLPRALERSRIFLEVLGS